MRSTVIAVTTTALRWAMRGSVLWTRIFHALTVRNSQPVWRKPRHLYVGNAERIDVLPFHQIGKYKWKQLGIEYKLETFAPPATDAVERACAVFRGSSLTTY
jgi:pyruvate-formate lyase-activating enzyme